MPTFDISGVEVEFPFTPYDCQLAYMTKVITALQKGQNALLESPTGTGKTLCLLCAALAWQKTMKAKAHLAFKSSELEIDAQTTALSELASKLEKAAGAWEGGSQAIHVPKILYASRTHTQLSQTIKELKATSYKPHISALASREQLCINRDVISLESNGAKTALCRSKVQSRTCAHLHQLESTRNDRPPGSLGIMDIEDLVAHGQETGVCPYYLTREDQESADMLILPYNYLLDRNMRRAQKIPIAGSIVIIDEAHNIEKQAEDSASFELTPAALAGCIDEASKVLNMDPALFDGEGQLQREDVNIVKTILLDFEEQLLGVDIGSAPEGRSWPGTFVYDLFLKVNIKQETCGNLLNVLNRIVGMLAADKVNGGRTHLTTFIEMLGVVFDPEVVSTKVEHLSKHYKVHIREQDDKKPKKKQKNTWGESRDEVPLDHRKGRVLSFWCFSPGIAIKEFEALGTHSIVLTSGTLSPIASFAAELMVDFPVVLENPHVISQKQVWVGVVQKGPGGCELSSAYQTRSRPEYKRDLGNTIVNFARIVPAGVLVFFPSYFVMRDCISEWQQLGNNSSRSIWDRISQFKTPIVEPQNKAEFVGAMHEFYEKVKDPTHSGAIFFAVCRGKVSEGLDFADNNGRAVIITGMPYPPFKDPKVMLKREHCDSMVRTKTSTLNGGDWYQQQSSRAVNQAIGRVIRHKQDYGAIIFCDARFAQPKNIAQMPRWVRPSVTICNSFGEIQRSLSSFFKSLAGNMVFAKPSIQLQTKEINTETAQSKRSDKRLVKLKSQSSETANTKSDNRHIHLKYDDDDDDDPRARHSSKTIKRKAPCLLVALDTNKHTKKQTRSNGDVKVHSVNDLDVPSIAKSDTIEFKKRVSAKAMSLYASAADITPVQAVPKTSSTADVPTGAEQRAAHVAKVKSMLAADDFRTFTALLKSFKVALEEKKVSPVRAMITLLIGLKKLFAPFGRAAGAELLDNFRRILPRDKQKLFQSALSRLKKQSESGTASASSRSRDPDGITVDKRRTRELHEDFAGRFSARRSKLPALRLDADRTPQQNDDSKAEFQVKSDLKPEPEPGPEPGPETVNLNAHVDESGGLRSNQAVPEEHHTSNGSGSCPKCYDKLTTPFRAPCSHACCFKCWHIMGNNLECPVSGCARQFRRGELKKVYFF